MKTTVILFVMSVGTVVSASIVEWSASDGGNGHYYEAILDADGITWDSASTAATLAGGYLATISSAQENAFVYDLVDDDTDFWLKIPNSHNPSFLYYEGPWLGGFRNDQSQWEWVTGEDFSYTDWAPSQPIPNAGYDKLQFWGAGSMSQEWDNQYYSDTANGYVIEYIPEPATLLLLTLGAVVGRKR